MGEPTNNQQRSENETKASETRNEITQENIGQCEGASNTDVTENKHEENSENKASTEPKESSNEPAEPTTNGNDTANMPPATTESPAESAEPTANDSDAANRPTIPAESPNESAEPTANDSKANEIPHTNHDQSQNSTVELPEEEQALVSHKVQAFPQAFPSGHSSSPTAIRVTASEMEVTELKVRNICQEKSLLALKMELRAAEMKLDANQKVDEKKTRLVELLDRKLESVEGRNVKLMDMLEQMLKDKNGNTNRLKEATKNMEELTQRLVQSERIKTELLKQNKELKSMLASVETKGTQIAKLAKEKVTKFRDEKDQMEQQLNDLKEERQGEALGSHGVTNSSTHAKELDPVSTVLWNKVTSINEKLSAALQSADPANITAESAKQFLDDTISVHKNLTSSLEDVKACTSERIAILDTENEQLRVLVDDFDETRKGLEKSARLSKDILAEKEKEIASLQEELNRLKNAIGQLIGGAPK